MAKLLWQRFGIAWAGQTSKHQHWAFPSLLQLLLAATGSLEEKVRLLLRYWLSSRAMKVLMLCKFWTATSHWWQFFFSCEMKFWCILQSLVTDPSPRSLLRSISQWLNGLLVKIRPSGKGSNQHVPNRVLCKKADLSRRPIWETVCSDSNPSRIAWPLQMAARKSLGKTSTWSCLPLPLPTLADVPLFVPENWGGQKSQLYKIDNLFWEIKVSDSLF